MFAIDFCIRSPNRVRAYYPFYISNSMHYFFFLIIFKQVTYSCIYQVYRSSKLPRPLSRTLDLKYFECDSILYSINENGQEWTRLKNMYMKKTRPILYVYWKFNRRENEKKKLTFMINFFILQNERKKIRNQSLLWLLRRSLYFYILIVVFHL